MILLVNFMARMSKGVCPLSVICQEQHPLRVVVKTPHGINSFTDTLEKIGYQGAALRVLQGRHVPGRLVENKIHTGGVHAELSFRQR